MCCARRPSGGPSRGSQCGVRTTSDHPSSHSGVRGQRKRAAYPMGTPLSRRPLRASPVGPWRTGASYSQLQRGCCCDAVTSSFSGGLWISNRPAGLSRDKQTAAARCGAAAALFALGSTRTRRELLDGDLLDGDLLDGDFGAGCLEGGLRLLGRFLGALFDDGLGRAIDEVLGFLQAEARELADGLDDLDLLGASLFEDNVELVLLLDLGSSGAATAGRASCGDRD